MALIITLGLFVASVLTAVLAGLAADEFGAWTPSMIRNLIKFAVRRLPENQRERFHEEWQSHVNDVPGRVGKLLVAAGFSIAAYDLVWNDRRNQVLGYWAHLLTLTDDVNSTTTTVLNLLQNDVSLVEGVNLGDELHGLIEKQEASGKNRLRSLLIEDEKSRNELREHANLLRSHLRKSQKNRDRLAKLIAVASAIPHAFIGNLLYTLVDSVQLRKRCDRALQLARDVRELGANIAELKGEQQKIGEKKKEIVKLIEAEKSRRHGH
jgi:hypothetical protein